MFKILAAVDRSSYASVVLETVSRLASYVESDVVILSVTKPVRHHTSQSAEGDEMAMREFQEDLIRKYFPQNLLAIEAKSDRDPKLFSTQGATVHSRVVEGDPADTICKLAENMNADLVVVGKRGRGKIGALHLGSVSEKVVHKCARSVLVAKSERRTDSTWMNDLPSAESDTHPVSHRANG